MDTLQRCADSSQAAGKLLSLLSRLKASGKDLEELATAIIEFARNDGGSLPTGFDAGGSKQKATETSEVLAKVEGVQFVSPRGKFDISLHKEAFTVRNPKQELTVQYGDIRHIAIIDQIPKDNKTGRVLLVVQTLRTATAKQRVGSEVVVLQVFEAATLDIPSPKSADTRLTGPAAVVLCQAFGAAGVAPNAFVTPNANVFQTPDGSSAVEAVIKVDQGWLFLLEPAFCFLEKPATWVSHADIERVEFSRLGAGSRSFDVHLHLKDDSLLELGGIDQRHADAVAAYCARSRLTVGVEGGDTEADRAVAAEDDESSSKEICRSGNPVQHAPTIQSACIPHELQSCFRFRNCMLDLLAIISTGGAPDSVQSTLVPAQSILDSDFDPEASSASEGRRDGHPDQRPASDADCDGSEGSESNESDISVVSDEDIPSSKIRGLVQQAGEQKKRKRGE